MSHRERSAAILGILLLFSWVLSSKAEHGAGKSKAQGLGKTATTNYYVPFSINNIFTYYSNNGDGAKSPYTGAGFFEFPKGSAKSSVFEDGLVWGCFQSGMMKVGGSTYRHGLQEGRIIVSGSSGVSPIADDPALPANRVYRVRGDVTPTTQFSTVETALNEEVALINRFASTTAADLYSWYVQDWNEWPAAAGAPFDDRNSNGVYDPSVDIPGMKGADQTLWHVSNDLNATLTTLLYGSTPIGIELQRTIWGYNHKGALGNTIFIRYKIINKSGTALDSMFVSQWSDPDLGNADDDYAGCDTSLSLGFVYNGKAVDGTYGDHSPALGYDFLQGPIVRAAVSDTAIFDFKNRPGYKNLAMSSFNFFINVNALYSDPLLGAYEGTTQWYNLMHGLIGQTGAQYIDPTTGQPTKFIFSGDPVTQMGWLNEMSFLPSDIRIAQTAGPFTMAPGDTQEVVVGVVVSQGYDRLSSVSALKRYDRFLQDTYNSLFQVLPAQPPDVSVTVKVSPAQPTNVVITANATGTGATSIVALLKQYTGATLSSIQLYDDGTHGDGSPADGVFANSVDIPQQADGIYLGASVTYPVVGSVLWEPLVDEITTLGPLEVQDPIVVSDNLNSDGVVNYSESIRFTASVVNNSVYDVNGLYVVGGSVWYDTVSGNGVKSLTYNPGDPSTYFDFTTMDSPSPGGRDTVYYPIVLRDASHNRWEISPLEFAIHELPNPIYTSPITHSSGLAGNFDIRVVNPSVVKNHTYVITGLDSINDQNERGFTLRDATIDTVLLLNQPLPDSLGHTAPVVDGFRILLGSVDPVLSGITSWNVGGVRHWTWTPTTLGMDGFNGAIGSGDGYWFGGSSVLCSRDVEVRFANTNTAGTILDLNDANASYAYRYLRGAQNPPAQPSFAPFILNPGESYNYQDYTKSMPFAAYDRNSSPPRRLMMGYLENNATNGLVDGRYWPPYSGDAVYADNVSSTGPREWFFIFSTTYSTTPDPGLQVNPASNALPLLMFGTVDRRDTLRWSSADTFRVFARHPITSSDTWTFNPTVIQTGVTAAETPASFALLQNYPNPFNPITTIRFSLAGAGKVTLKIYNVLGQEVRTLFDGEQSSGVQTLRWDGKSQGGCTVASGVYFYRIVVEGKHGGTVFTAVRKMQLLR